MNAIIKWFSEPGHAAFSAFVVSVAALVVSVWAIVISRRTHKRTVEIEEAREKDRLTEKTKASLTADICKEPLKPGVWSYSLIIKNSGRGKARDVTVKAVGSHKFASKVPASISEIRPGATYPIVLDNGTRGTQAPLTVEITWTDDSGEPGGYRTTVTL